MAQVNVAYDDELLSRADALAGQRSMSRPDLLRAVLAEAVQAGAEGRDMFAASQAVVEPERANELIVKLSELAMEIERASKSWARREKQLVERFGLSEQANREAHQRASEEIVQRFREGAQPFAAKVDELHEAFDGLRGKIMDAVSDPAWIGEMRTKLEAIHDCAREPRQQTYLTFGRSWSFEGWFVPVLGVFAVAFMVLSVWGISMVLPYSWWANPITSRFYPSGERAVCEQFKYAYDVDRCPEMRRVPEDKP